MATREELAAHLRVFADLGVNGISRDPSWRRRQGVPSGVRNPVQDEVQNGAHGLQPVRTPPGAEAPGLHGTPTSADALPALRAELGDCTRCALHALGRKQIVFGVGNPDADLMFVGEAPGENEDVQGEPFVGEAGQLLTKIIEAIGLKRSDVYIANVIKCRPPNNRNPEPDEIATCSPFLLRQIDIVRPKVLVALGTFSAQLLLGTTTPISRLRGRFHDYRNGIKLMPTFHPAYLLRSPERKRDVWEDMKTVRAFLAESR